MATKSQIKNWVLAVRKKALDSVDKEYQKAKFDEIEIIMKEINVDGILASIQKHFDEAFSLDDILQDRTSYDGRIHYRDYNHLSNLLSKNVRNYFINNIKVESKELTLLAKNYDEKVRLVKDSYANVLAMVDSLTPKKAIEYLKELGFDTSSIEDKPKMELAVVNVDKRYLFVCGDNK